jgi:hypothetical protein
VTSSPYCFSAAPGLRRRPCSLPILRLVFAIFFVIVPSGCSRFKKPPKPDFVYVVAQQTYLRDRVAAVSNRVALVRNGERLEIVERGRRFLRVKTANNEIGWIEDHLIIEEPVYDQFVALRQQREHDPVVATGILRDDLSLHVKPGRTTDRFYLLRENDKLQMLLRVSIPKLNSQQNFMPASKPAAKASPPAAKKAPGSGSPPPVAPPIPMEDWWLVRDPQGHTGWLLGRQLDVVIPDAIGGYSEGQKMVGAYVLNTVEDPESPLADHQVPQYLAVLNAYKDGLPYDFDQFRVFTWNVKKHRYETAFRQRNVEGYLPVEVNEGQANHGQAGSPPTPSVFAIKVATSDAVATDPLTGAVHPLEAQTLRFELDGYMVRKMPESGEAAASAEPHPMPAHPVRHAHRARRHATS